MPDRPTSVVSGMIGSVFILRAVACAAAVQMTTWMPKYFSTVGHGGIPPLIFMVQAGFALLLLMPASSYFKEWGAGRLLALMIIGTAGWATSYALVAWTTPATVMVAAGLLAGGWLVASLTVAPVAQVLIARLSPSHRLGFGFGVLGLSESVGIAFGGALGAYLYVRAEAAGQLAEYWLAFGLISLALVSVGALWGLASLRRK